MKSLLKVFGILIGLVIVTLAAIVIYVSTLDPNDYKAMIADGFQEETGRSMSIDGDVVVTIYPWLGVEINDVTIGNAPGFGDMPFLQLQHAMVRLKLMPLLQEQYEIDTVRVHGLAINLMKDAAGTTNWADMEQRLGRQQRSDAGGLSLAAVVLGGVDIQDTSLTWDDQSTGTRSAISNLQMTTGELVYGEPIELDLNFDAVSNQPELVADISLTTTLNYDLDNETYDIAPLNFNTLLAGPNVPQGSTDITFSSAIQVDMGNETLVINDINFSALGTQMTGTIQAVDIRDGEPTLETDINLTGNDLALLFKVAEIEPLATQLAGLSDRAFSLNAAITADMANDEMRISNMQATMIGSEFNADISTRGTRTDSPAIIGNIAAAGPDLPMLLRVLGQLQGGADSGLSQLASQLQNVRNRQFNFSADIDADMGDGDFDISGLNASLLGSDIAGDIVATGMNSSAPTIRGNLNAAGPDLPALMQLLGQIQGGSDSALTVYGQQLGGMTNKAYTIETRFDANMTNGDINIPALSIDALGVQINGNLVANDMQQDNGSTNGQLAFRGSRPGPLLAAIDQGELGDVMQSINLTAAVNGTRTNLNISPLELNMVFAGEQIPNSPVQMNLSANTRLNLETESLALNNFQVAGLGLNVSGNINAEQIFDARQYRGDIEVAPFSLRQLVRQLNQVPPDTTDTRAYTNVALSTAFDGSANHLNVSRLAMVLDETNLNGTLSITDFENSSIQFGIDIDQINADRYLPPAEGNQPRPVTPETAVGAAAQLPLETLRALNIQGELKIGQLIISNARVSDVVLGMNAKDGKINLSPVSANLYEGSYRGDIQLNATSDQPTLSFDSALQGVNIDPLMVDVVGASSVSGTGNMELNVTASGIDTPTMISNLNGDGKIFLEDGILQGVDVARVLAQVEIMIQNRRPMQIDRGEQTPFDTFSSTLDIRGGLVRSNDLIMKAPGIQVAGQGTVINLNNNNINYDLVASADQGTATRGEEQYDIGGYSIPIKCSGNASDPSCLPNVEKIISEVVQRKVQKQIGNVLQRALGVPTEQTQQGTEPATQPQTQPQQQQPTQQMDPTEEILNRALEGIFGR